MKMETEGLLEQLTADIRTAVETFSKQGGNAKRLLDNLSGADPFKFFAAGIQVAGAVQPSDGSHYLFLLLAKDKRLTNWLLDPRACTLKEASALARAAVDARVQVEATFEMALNKALQNQASSTNSSRILRTMNLLEAISSHNCWNAFQVELMAYPDKVVRSKAALLIGHSGKNAAWIGRRLLDRDPRVQANAVETLWELSADESKPHLLDALKSKNNRVFANAALGLYRLGDPGMIVVLLEATRHPDPAFQFSALWAIGQTQDPRFLPALSLRFKSAQGKLRLAIAGAISRIRQREKTGADTSAFQIDISQLAAQTDGKRRLVVTVSSHPARKLHGLKATDFLILENGTLVEDFQVRLTASPDPSVTGFVAPWFESSSDPFERIVRETLKECLAMKRPDETWRIDRYSLAARANSLPPGEVKPADDSGPPYADAVITPHMKTAQGCVSEEDVLRKILDLAVPADRAATDGITAIERQCKAISQRQGRRHVFILLHEQAGADLMQETTASLLQFYAKNNTVVFHGIGVGAAGQWPLLRELCLSSPEGTIVETNEAGMADVLIRTYASLCNRFEISYSSLPGTEPGAGQPMITLKIASDHGSGQAALALDSQLAQSAADAPMPANTPAPAASPAPQESAA
jgi:HEAT repeats